MGLFPRVAKLSLAVMVVLVLTSLPAIRVDRSPGSAFTPTIAWASGSPDETLKPPPQPKKSSSVRTTVEPSAEMRVPSTSRDLSVRSLTALQRWQLFYRVFRIFAVRY